MNREVYYKCQYCGCRSRDKRKILKHERTCFNYKLEQDLAIQRITDLLHYYYLLGYSLTIIFKSDGEQLISVRHPNYGKL